MSEHIQGEPIAGIKQQQRSKGGSKTRRLAQRVARRIDTPVADTSIWLLGVVGGAAVPVAPLIATPLLAIAAVFYYGVKVNSHSQRPSRSLFLGAIASILEAGGQRLPKAVRTLSVWIPKGGHLVLAAKSGGYIPAEGRTRISSVDNCSIWLAYSTGRSTSEQHNEPEEHHASWDRREALPIPDIEDRISVAGVLSIEILGSLTKTEETNVVKAISLIRSHLVIWLSLLVVMSDV